MALVAAAVGGARAAHVAWRQSTADVQVCPPPNTHAPSPLDRRLYLLLTLTLHVRGGGQVPGSAAEGCEAPAGVVAWLRRAAMGGAVAAAVPGGCGHPERCSGVVGAGGTARQASAGCCRAPASPVARRGHQVGGWVGGWVLCTPDPPHVGRVTSTVVVVAVLAQVPTSRVLGCRAPAAGVQRPPGAAMGHLPPPRRRGSTGDRGGAHARRQARGCRPPAQP